ncbi:GNAT family N-acetyltransferase, partial [Vibrio sp. 10N.222.52.B7]
MVNIREMAISDYDSVIALWCQTEGMSIRDADSKES